jgi:hypothetical protein
MLFIYSPPPPFLHSFILHHLLDDDDDDEDDDDDKDCHCHDILGLYQTCKLHIPYVYKHILTELYSKINENIAGIIERTLVQVGKFVIYFMR